MPQCRMNNASLLAETIASELHSLAQPLTATQWHLEMASLPGTSTERQQTEVAEAFASLEGVIAHLDFLRDIIRPFRERTQFHTESLRAALLSAIQLQHEALQHGGVHVIVSQPCPDGEILAPSGFIHSILFKILDFLRTIAPVSVRFEILECDQMVHLVALSEFAGTPAAAAKHERTLSTIRSYVEVLAGECSISPDCAALQCCFPKSSM